MSSIAKPTERVLELRTLCVLVAMLFATNANANYKQLLKDGAARAEVQKLYSQYAAQVLNQSGSQSDVITRLAGGADYQDSFLLACLSNGWTIRATDIQHSLRPPAGVWAFSEANFGGVVRQFPADCKDQHCFDIDDIGDFNIKSMLIGKSLHILSCSELSFGGRQQYHSGSVRSLRREIKSIKIRTKPRIDYVSISEYIQSSDRASFHLHVSGANIDAGAQIYVTSPSKGKLPYIRTTIQTRLDNSAWLGLGKDIAQAGYNLDPTYFAFPILHYDSIVAHLQDYQVGEEITIKVMNRDGEFSNKLDYTVPSTETLDSDGDGLLDEWEINGVDGLDLPKMGANPMRKDAYIEVDRMIVRNRVWSDFAERDYPRPSIFPDAEKLFAQAPIINPDGSAGIAMHIDYGQASFEQAGEGKGGSEIPWSRYMGFRDVSKWNKKKPPPEGQYVNVMDVRRNPEYFDANRRRVFGYCVFADQRWKTRSTGESDAKSTFVISLGVCRLRAIDHNYQLGVFTHELGHTMGLSHGGNQNWKYMNKPNFNSLMNYLFTTPGHDIDGRLADVEGVLTGDNVYAYSEGMRANLDESNLQEALGVANHYPHDWNGDAKIDSTPVQKIFRGSRFKKFKLLKDCDDWSKLKFPVGSEDVE